ncbi:hypothetical protein [Streptomyces albidoflavus]|uniref:hypothetical protein n=1 Tax=Streptomyces albidoflavus TaxID=1886 RepID=UPI0033168B1B
MELDPIALPEIGRPPLVEYAESMFPMIGTGEARYLMAWGTDVDGELWAYILWRPQTLVTHEGVRHQGYSRWVLWEDVRPIEGEDYSSVPRVKALQEAEHDVRREPADEHEHRGDEDRDEDPAARAGRDDPEPAADVL